MHYAMLKFDRTFRAGARGRHAGARGTAVAATVGSLLLMSGAGAPLAAQAAGPGAPLGAARDAIAAQVDVDSMALLASPRTESAIEREIDRARRVEREAENTRERAERNREHARAAREVQEREMKRLESAIDIADDMDDDRRKKALEDERELRERYRDMLGQRAEVHEAEAETAEHRRRHARALRELLEREQDLAEDMRDWRRLRGPDADRDDAEERRTRLRRDFMEHLKKFLEAERDEARARERTAEAERKLSERKLDLLERRRDLLED